MSIADELEKFANLRDKGLLTEDEFQAQKAKILRINIFPMSEYPNQTSNQLKDKTEIKNISAFCISCGKENFPNSKFCKKCGRSLISENGIECIHCVKCGTILSEGVKYCPKCGQSASKAYPTEQHDRAPVLPEGVRQKLLNYKEIAKNVTCGECGYVGKMGIVKKHVPWYLTWWLLVPLICTGIGIIPAFILGAIRAFLTKYEMDCPHCSARLVSDR